MNLRTQISDRLWEAIASAYEAGNYAHAVLEAIHVITDVLRDKSGLDGDGNQLVGQALGGENPKIRLNSLQTDTERNIQKGFESILRGVYSAIRNPRSHESACDKREHADAIICFTNYLLAVLDASKEAFTTESFMERVTDPDFVDTKRYSALLVNEVPVAHRGDALIEIFKQRKQLPLQKRETLIRALFEGATDSQIGSLLALVSDEFRATMIPQTFVQHCSSLGRKCGRASASLPDFGLRTSSCQQSERARYYLTAVQMNHLRLGPATSSTSSHHVTRRRQSYGLV